MQREYLDRQTRAALGSTTGQDFPAVFRAHPFAEAVLSLLFEIRRLLKRKRHTDHPFQADFASNFTPTSAEVRIIGARRPTVKPTDVDDPQ